MSAHKSMEQRLDAKTEAMLADLRKQKERVKATLSDEVKAALIEVGINIDIDVPPNATEASMWSLVEESKRRDAETIHTIPLGRQDESEGTGVPVYRNDSTRKDYDPEAVKELTDLKRDLAGRLGFDEENNWFDLFEGTSMNSICREPGNEASVFNGEYAGSEMICDDVGPLPGKWRVVLHASGHIDGSKAHRNFSWYSSQVKPTLENVVAKVDRYLKDSGDWHGFLASIRINHKDRTLWCVLES